jgi:predicted dehydrogenase
MSENHNDSTKSSRRDLFRFATLATAGLAVNTPAPAAPAESMMGVPFERKDKVRVGFIGVGGRGSGLLRNFAAVDHVEIVAACDIQKEKVARVQQMVGKLGQKTPVAAYSGSERAWEELPKRDDVDLVVIATPWKYHVPMAVFAMQHGKHVATEVPAAKTVEECWDLVNTSEKTRRHCIMLENCCYGYNELLVLNMVRAGVFGELTHGACAYDHDLRSILFSNEGEGLWRRFEHLNRNGNLYPTHGLGPVARYMDIGHGDRFETLVSMSSAARSLAAYRAEHLKADDPRMKETYRCGDQNTSLIKTAKGRLITLEHNVSSPEPYDRINLIAGTKGIFRDYPPRVFVDNGGKDEFTAIDKYKAQYEHDYWKTLGDTARKLGGHGGMDFLECYRVARCMQEGIAPDMDVYDAAAWSAPGPLSEQSVAKGSAPMQFPDFTRGRWQKPRA